MVTYLKEQQPVTLSLAQALDLALRAWAIGSLAQQQDEVDQQAEAKLPTSGAGSSAAAIPGSDALIAHVRGLVGERMIESAVLERQAPGSSKYRPLKQEDLSRLLPTALQSVVTN
jgi:hypothetical protein